MPEEGRSAEYRVGVALAQKKEEKDDWAYY